MHKTFFQTLKQEPLFHFILLGSLLFILNAFMADKDQPTITLTYYQALQMIEDQSKLLGRPLTKNDSALLIDSFFEDEILLRESYKQGLDQYDSRIRKRLIDKMRVVLYGDFEDPSEDSLRVFYRQHKEQYRISKSKSFEHVFFFENHFDQVKKGQDVLKLLKEGQDPDLLGDAFYQGKKFNEMTRFDLIREFGMTFANMVDQAQTGSWAGPISSKHGIHFVKITEVQGLEYLPFEAVKSYLINDYVQQLQEKSFQIKMDSISRNYKLDIELQPAN